MMNPTTFLARFGLLAVIAGSLSACGAASPTGFQTLQAVAKDLPATAQPAEPKGSALVAPVPAAGTLSADEAKLYAKGFHDGYKDHVRTQRFARDYKTGMLRKRQYDDRHTTGYVDSNVVAGNCVTTDGITTCSPQTTTPKTEALIANEPVAPLRNN